MPNPTVSVQILILFALHINTNRFSNAISQNDITKSLFNHHISLPGHRGLDVRNVLGTTGMLLCMLTLEWLGF